PSTWSVLLVASSTMRKSTSIRLGVRLLEQMEGGDNEGNGQGTSENRQRGIILPRPGSLEGLEETMGVRSDGLLVAYEFGELLATLGREHMAGTKERLTAWFDGDSTARATRKDQTRYVRDPAITILGASTPAWLEDRARDGDIRGGFLARMLWWPAHEAEKNGWRGILDQPPDGRAERALLINTLTKARVYKGAFAVEPAARDRFHAWLRPHEEGYSQEDFPRQLSGF